MAYVVIEDFKGGLDSRRRPITLPPGTLVKLENAHITRGAEIEKRKALADYATLPPGTFGLAGASGKVWCFGSADLAATVPAGMSYQRLQSPDGGAMTRIHDVETYDGKLYVIAGYDDGSVWHFFDGQIVHAWKNGVVRLAFANNDGIATHLAAIINRDASDKYTAVAATNVVTITGKPGTPFTIAATASNGGANTTQAAAVATTTPAIAGEAEVLSSSSFTITGGTDGVSAKASFTITGGTAGGGNQIGAITVNGVAVISAAVLWATSNEATAAAVAAAINAYNSTPEYTATSSGATVTVSSATNLGVASNGFPFVVTPGGTVTVGSVSATLSGGEYSRITSITVDGVEVLGAPISWQISHSGTATNVANQINTYVGSTDYDATTEAAKVIIKAKAGTGANPNGKAVVVTVAGNVTTSTPAAMAGGKTAVAGQAQVSTVTINGAFEVGDRFTVTLDNVDYGAAGHPASMARIVRAHSSKVYAAANSVLYFCGVDAPLKWNTEDTGAGFINMSNQGAGDQELTGIEIYANNMAVFTEDAIQIWFMEADPSANQKLQTMQNTGAIATESIVAYGDTDVFYLSRSGIRSLRARDSSNAAFVSDVGTAIDELVTEHCSDLPSATVAKSVAVLEPIDARYWLDIDGTSFVFSYFPGSKISAWSTYNWGDAIENFAVVGQRVYARRGDQVYLYGGATGNEYDDTVVKVVLPFLSASKDATLKDINGFDVALEGEWDVYACFDPNYPDDWVHMGTYCNITYNGGENAFDGVSTHVALKLISKGSGYHRIMNLTLHYNV
jgi:hypothetical protein